MTTSDKPLASAVGRAEDRRPIDIRLLGGPTLLINIGGLAVLTDPTFDPPGDHPVGERVLVKLAGPAIAVDELPDIDVVLLSHEQHPDNLDDLGRSLLTRSERVYTTQQSAAKLGGNAVGVMPWTSVQVPRPNGRTLKITAVPAHHGPHNVEHLTGHVIGFVLSGSDLPTTYVSGDNASLHAVGEIADHSGPIEIAILFGGRARSPLMDAYLTLSSSQLVEAAKILEAPVVVPAHLEGWGHLTQGPDTVRDAFTDAGEAPRLMLLNPGEQVTL